MTAAPLQPSAAEIRERLEATTRRIRARQHLRKLLAEGKTSAAVAVANALGEPLPRHQIVRIEFSTRRLTTQR